MNLFIFECDRLHVVSHLRRTALLCSATQFWIKVPRSPRGEYKGRPWFVNLRLRVVPSAVPHSSISGLNIYPRFYQCVSAVIARPRRLRAVTGTNWSLGPATSLRSLHVAT